MPTLLAVAYGGGHLNALLPVIRRLRADPAWRVQVLALTTATAACIAAGIPCVGFRDFPAIQDERSRRHGERLAGAQVANPLVPREETVAYLGANWRDLEDAIGAEEADRRHAAEGRQCFLPIASLSGIIDQVRPDVVLTTSAPRAERAAVIAARRRGIPAVCVVDLFGLAETGWLQDPDFADVVCVLGQPVVDHLVAAGRPREHLVITGNPVFDRLGDPALVERGLALRAARGWQERRVILWASQPEPADPQLPRRIEQALIAAAAAAHPDWLVLLRPHPNDQYQLPAAGPQVAHSTRADDLAATIAASDVVVTMTSTVGLEAVIAGKPLVTWDLSANTRDCPYSRLGFSVGVSELGGFDQALQRALRGAAPRPVLPPVGHGTDLVVEQVLRLSRR